MTLNPERAALFAQAYAAAVMAVLPEVRPHLSGQSLEQYALDAALAIMDLIGRKGIEVAGLYYLNARGGAFLRTCESLGIEHSSRAMANYLGGA